MTVFAWTRPRRRIEPKGPAYPNGGGAACWTALSPDGKTLYTGNFVGNSISAYAVMPTVPVAARHRRAPRGDEAGHERHRDLTDGKYLYAIGPIAGTSPSSRSAPTGCRASCRPAGPPYTVTSGQWTTGLVVK
jgi:hypothetical protein